MQKTLFLMLGYPGAGKTTAAKIIANLAGAEHLWADKVRRETYHSPTYSHSENLKLYGHLNQVAEGLLKKGKSVIFDTNFNFYKDRENLQGIAENNNAKTWLVWVQTAKGLAKQRAVVDAHLHAHTRVLGHMPESHFERISGNLEEPRQSEDYIVLDGTKLTEDYVKQALVAAHIL